MPELLTERVPLGVSACLDRCPVRHDGKALDALGVLGRERAFFSLTPVCPECAAGLGVPREPLHLTGTGQDVLAGDAGVRDRGGRDVTERLLAGVRTSADTLRRAGAEALVLKEGSPSCGLRLARVGGRRRQATGAGVFGALALQYDWFLIPDTALASPLRWWDARRRLHAWLWLRRRELRSMTDVRDTWHVLRALVTEVDRRSADALGSQLASRGEFTPMMAEDFRRRAGEALRRASTPARIRHSMWKSYTRLRRRGELEGVGLGGLTVDSPEVRRNQTRIAEELLALEKVSYQHDALFGPSPVLARCGPYAHKEQPRHQPSAP